MEGKRAVAIVALCLLMLLLGQQQVAATSKFCTCFKKCYPVCRTDAPRWVCVPRCSTICAFSKEKVAALTSVDDCSKICLTSICGTTTTDTSGATTCVDDCTKNQIQYTKHL